MGIKISNMVNERYQFNAKYVQQAKRINLNNTDKQTNKQTYKVITVDELIDEPGATAKLNSYKDISDPQYTGPGTWNLIHRMAFKARTKEERLSFIRFMMDACYGFPCTVCKVHCTEYIQNHPLTDYLDVSINVDGENLPLGLFIWTWKFHNAVNKRINKPLMNWDTAYNLYSSAESLVCSKTCTASAH